MSYHDGFDPEAHPPRLCIRTPPRTRPRRRPLLVRLGALLAALLRA